MDCNFFFVISTLAASFAVLVWGVLTILPKDISEDLQEKLLGYCHDFWTWLLWLCSKGLPNAFLGLLRIETLGVIVVTLSVLAVYRWPARVGDLSDEDEVNIVVVPPVPGINMAIQNDTKSPPRTDHAQPPRKVTSKKSVDKLKLSNISRRSSRSYNDVLADMSAVTKDEKKGSSFSVPDDLDFDETKDWSYHKDKFEPMSAADLDRLEAVMREGPPQHTTRTPKTRATKTPIVSMKTQVAEKQDITTLLTLPPPLTFTPPANETTRALRAEYTRVAELQLHTPTPTEFSPRIPKFDVRAASLRYEDREGIAAQIGQERRERIRKFAAEARAQRLVDYTEWKGHEVRVVEADREVSKADDEQVELAIEGGSKKDDGVHIATINAKEEFEANEAVASTENDSYDILEDVDASFEADEAIARIDSEAEIVGGWEVDDVIVEGAFFP